MPNFGLGLGVAVLRAVRSAAVLPPDPDDPLREIFPNGEQGCVPDPSDFSANFQDDAGTIPVTALEQICGLALDTRLGLVRGPDRVLNGDFSAGTANWEVADAGSTISVVGGRLRIEWVSGAWPRAGQQISDLTIGETYELRYSVFKGSSDTIIARVAPSMLSSGIATQISTADVVGGRLIFRATAAVLWIVFLGDMSAAGQYMEVDDVSFRALPGNHAIQVTTTKRLKISARINQITNSAMAGGGAVPPGGWTQPEASGSSVPAGTDAHGNVIYRQSALGEQPYFEQPGRIIGTSGSLTASLYIEAIHSGSANVAALIGWSHAVTATTQFFVDGVAVPGSTPAQAGTRISAVLTSSGTVGIVNPCFGAGVAVMVTVDLSFSRPQVDFGAMAMRYQRTEVNAHLGDYDADGFPVRYVGDGVDDTLVIPHFVYGGTRSQTVTVGLMKASDAERGMVVNSGVAARNGWSIEAPSGNRNNFASRLDDGADTLTNFLMRAPTSAVVTGIHSYGDRHVLRTNGVERDRLVSSGLGAFVDGPIDIGSRAGTSLFFRGGISSLVLYAGQAAATPEQVAAMEAWCNKKEGAYSDGVAQLRRDTVPAGLSRQVAYIADTTYVDRTLIVPAISRDLYAQLAEALAGPSGANMFTTSLSPTATEPVTHFISAGAVDKAMAAAMADSTAMLAACQEAGIEVTLEECADLLAACHVSQEEPHMALARLGLSLIHSVDSDLP